MTGEMLFSANPRARFSIWHGKKLKEADAANGSQITLMDNRAKAIAPSLPPVQRSCEFPSPQNLLGCSTQFSADSCNRLGVSDYLRDDVEQKLSKIHRCLDQLDHSIDREKSPDYVPPQRYLLSKNRMPIESSAKSSIMDRRPVSTQAKRYSM